MIIGIVLAGGKGTRLGLKNKNKTSVLFNGKPLVSYAIDLYHKICEKTVVVTGHQSESIKQLLSSASVISAYQAKRLGTGHAAKIAIEKIAKEGLTPEYVFIGYGDHMMFYTPELLKNLLKKVQESQAVVGLLSTRHTNPMELVWGRLIRGEDGMIEKIVEQKNASEEEKKVTLINPGFYCVKYDFAKRVLKKLKKNPISHEYYLTDIIEIARSKGENVVDLEIPFEKVGIGINTTHELEESQKLYRDTNAD
jgi:bifunctional UDP-N-acetylglucosamine pyrophosphorylase/glucosamine-1-phosphate N-acetyltransferase